MTPLTKLKDLDGQILKERETKLDKRREQYRLKYEKFRQTSSDGAKMKNAESNGSQEYIRISAEGRNKVALCRMSS